MTQDSNGRSPGQPAIREQIDENLKRVYAAEVSDEVPERFRVLLAQLKARSQTQDSGTQ